MKRLGPSAALGLVLLAAGCCGEQEGLTVHGSIRVAILEAETGFSFAGETRLSDEAEAEGGAIAGRCTIDPAASRVEVGIGRTGSTEEGSREIRSFSAELRQAGLGVEGEVEVELGQETFRAAGEGGCVLEVVYTDERTGQAGIRAGCALASAGGEEAELEAELHFRSCRVIEAE